MSDSKINLNNEIDFLFKERKDFIVIGLTGRTGAGCSTVADYLNKDFAELSLSQCKELKNNGDRREKIIYKYGEKNWSKFTKVQVASIMITFMLDDIDFEKLKEFIIDTCNEKKSNFLKSIEKKFEDCKDDKHLKDIRDFKEMLENGCNEEFGDDLCERILKSDYKNLKNIIIQKYNHKIDLLEKGLNETIKNEYDEIRDKYKKLGELIEKDPKDMTKEEIEKLNYFYLKDLVDFNNILKRKLHEIQNDLYTSAFQKIGNNIRKFKYGIISNKIEGNPNIENLFALPKRIQFVIKIIRERSKKLNQSTLIVIDSFKNPYEVIYFKERYAAFYLFSVNATKKCRESKYDGNIEEIDNIEDGKNIEGKECNDTLFKQNITKCIELSDVYLNNSEDLNSKYSTLDKNNDLKKQIVKYISLIMHPGLITPTKIERCMQLAYNAKVSSGCISRQVGAVITDSNYSIKAIGWNNVPDGQVPCNLKNIETLLNESDYSSNYIGTYSNFERENREFRRFVYKKWNRTGVLENRLRGRTVSYCFKDIYNGLKEDRNQVHTRSLHAEENAFLQLSKYGGVGIEGGNLFTTASCCELCAKKAYQLGIKNIYYIDLYPGISKPHILDSGKNKPEMILFNGAIGTAYTKLYTPLIPYKDELKILTGVDFKKLE